MSRCVPRQWAVSFVAIVALKDIHTLTKELLPHLKLEHLSRGTQQKLLAVGCINEQQLVQTAGPAPVSLEEQ